MKHLTWPDNICTVGWTSIHGTFTNEEVKEILDRLQGSSFTRTAKSGSGDLIGYIDFKEDPKGIAFLTELKFKFPDLTRSTNTRLPRSPRYIHETHLRRR